MLPHDSRHDAISSTGFPMWDVETALKRFVKAKRVVVVGDAYHSGGVGAGFDVARRAAGDQPNRISAGLQGLASVGDGIAVLSASDDRQLSVESAKFGGGHGVFTHYLLEGLKGGAARPSTPRAPRPRDGSIRRSRSAARRTISLGSPAAHDDEPDVGGCWVRFTRYFEAMRRRPDRAMIRVEWIEQVVRHPVREVIQADGRIRRWARIVLLADGETVHNVFFDRSFTL